MKNIIKSFLNKIVKKSALTACCIGGYLTFKTLLYASGTEQAEKLERMLEAARFDEVKKIVEVMADMGEKHFWESRIAFFRGDYPSSVREIDEALKYPFKGSAQWENLKFYYLAEMQVTSGMKEYESLHFRIKVSGKDTILAGYLTEMLEKAYNAVGAGLDYLPEDKITVEVYQTKKEFSLASTLSEEILEKTGTVGICKFNKLMILSPQSLPLGYMWMDTLSHEYVHMAVNRLSGGECPLWLHEGTARYYETMWRSTGTFCLTDGSEHLLKKAAETGKYITFKRMSPSLVYLDTQDDIVLAFAEAAMAVEYIKKRYGNVVGSLMRLIRESGVKGAFKKQFGLSVEKMENNVFSFIKSSGLKSSPGVITEEVMFKEKPEDEFIGTSAKGHVRLGDRMRQIKRPDAALVNYQNALLEEPANPVIMLKAARALIEMRKDEEALPFLRKAIEVNPGYVTPYQVLGETLYKLKSYPETVSVCEEALRINPFHPGTHYYLARACIAQGLYEKGFRELEITVFLDPADYESRVILDRMRK